MTQKNKNGLLSSEPDPLFLAFVHFPSPEIIGLFFIFFNQKKYILTTF